MNECRGEILADTVKIYLSGRIDSNNARAVEQEAAAIISGSSGLHVVLDAGELEYISSAGLRILLHIRKEHPDMVIENVGSDVYEILDMTGFTQMLDVRKAYRTVSVEGAEVIGRGANGTLYRIDQDNVVKVYNNADALSEIQNEREVARLALVLGIPTAISYDVVRVGDSYGSVFELLNARSFTKLIVSGEKSWDWIIDEYVGMLKRIHSTVVPDGRLGDFRETAVSWAKTMQGYLPEEEGDKLLSLIEAVPYDNHMIHGDYHTKNLELTDDEVLLIDMDTLAVGNPVFEFGSIYNAFVGFSEYDHSVIERFQGFDYETGCRFWKDSLSAYLGTDDPDTLRDAEDKARIIGYTRLIRRSLRRGGLEDPEKKKEIEYWTEQLIPLLHRYDTLEFGVSELTLAADTANLPQVMGFVEEQLERHGCPVKTAMQIQVAVEEIFVNIASYAYPDGAGDASVRMKFEDDPARVEISFIDSGIAYDPLKRDDPDITLPAEERESGGLGIYMVKKYMDDIRYEYTDGRNRLTLIKHLV